uniref:Putative secreted protein n=1 Tax=Anopheles triannulatus TaxID=58253 RepID=A0A2M4B5V5_9DIPT
MMSRCAFCLLRYLSWPIRSNPRDVAQMSPNVDLRPLRSQAHELRSHILCLYYPTPKEQRIRIVTLEKLDSLSLVA